MSEKINIIICNICQREYKKYDKKDISKLHGISLARSSTYSLKLDFVKPDKSEINRHICTYCIADILNKFGT